MEPPFYPDPKSLSAIMAASMERERSFGSGSTLRAGPQQSRRQIEQSFQEGERGADDHPQESEGEQQQPYQWIGNQR
jgi:hypothetical protein